MYIYIYREKERDVCCAGWKKEERGTKICGTADGLANAARVYVYRKGHRATVITRRVQ